jgi:HKD family nuclease
MLITQNSAHPAQIQNALLDLLRDGVQSIRVCSAYMSLAGSKLLLDAVTRAARKGRHENVRKTIVTSLDFGLTEPAALDFWMRTANCSVLVAGTRGLANGQLLPAAAFHPKFCIVNRSARRVGTLVGSANFTSRGLTINSEVAWLELEHDEPQLVDDAWAAAIQPAIPLTPEILEQYRALRKRIALRRPPSERIEVKPVPRPALEPPRQYPSFVDSDIDARAFDQMWIQASGLAGGSSTQLELPRGAHRFFGAKFNQYAFARVRHIGEPTLVAGHSKWRGCSLTWHGHNRMERINLPSRAKGGFAYANSLVLFRRLAQNTFELRVHEWNSDSARACVEASRRASLVFRVGRSDRLTGFLN